MPLIECIDCKAQISDQATACPHCGNPVKNSLPKPEPKPSSSFRQLLGYGILGTLVIWLIFKPAPRPDLPPDPIREAEIKRDFYANQCKNGYASSCVQEQNYAQLLITLRNQKFYQ